MKPFTYERSATVDAAVAAVAGRPDARYLAGGTNLVDLMKLGVEAPAHLVDITRLPLTDIEERADGSLRIGALVSNTDVAADLRVRRRYPALAQALLAGASGQLRNRATVGGNLLQRTRCYYFYDPLTPCNKREPGSGCSAIQGFNRMHGILGVTEACIAVHPSDMAVALALLDARIDIVGPSGARTTPVSEFYVGPGHTPQVETALSHGELITGVTIPSPPAGKQIYWKIRDRASYAFAVVSVAAMLELEGGGIRHARFALGGVAPRPWRIAEAERAMEGNLPRAETFGEAARIALEGAQGFGHNDFKIDLAKQAIEHAFERLAA